MPDQFPSLKAGRLLAVLCREPLGYSVRQEGTSHRRLTAPGRPTLTFAFHLKATLPGGLVRRILVRDVGLSTEEAREVIK